MTSRFRLLVDVDVQDALALWRASRAELATTYAMPDDIIVDTIGPLDDPDVAQCLMAIAAPTRWPGCAIDLLNCAPAPASLDGDPRGTALAGPAASPRPSTSTPHVAIDWGRSRTRLSRRLANYARMLHFPIM